MIKLCMLKLLVRSPQVEYPKHHVIAAHGREGGIKGRYKPDPWMHPAGVIIDTRDHRNERSGHRAARQLGPALCVQHLETRYRVKFPDVRSSDRLGSGGHRKVRGYRA